MEKPWYCNVCGSVSVKDPKNEDNRIYYMNAKSIDWEKIWQEVWNKGLTVDCDVKAIQEIIEKQLTGKEE